MINAITQALSHLSAYHYLIILVNLLLMVLAKPLILKTGGEQSERQLDFRINMLRVLNLAILATVCYNAIYSDSSNNAGFAVRLISILVVFYLAYLASNIANYLMRRRYGKVTKSKQGTQVSDTYHSRMLTLVVSTFIAICALIAIIRIAGFNSLLETGGAIGFIGVFLALTQAAWAPDIISGLVLLNSEMVSEGDLIEIEAPDTLLARVFKTKIFHTVLIDVVNNHRIMMSNSTLRAHPIHSLSKFASAKGLREKLSFKIGYDVTPDQVKAMFNVAYDEIVKGSNSVDDAHPLEIKVLETGDHAVEWGVFYYIKEVQDIIPIRQLFTETILNTSVEHRISLSTPKTHVVTNLDEQQPGLA